MIKPQTFALLIICTAIVGQSGWAQVGPARVPGAEPLDTVRQVYTVVARPTIFERAFITGTTAGKGATRIRLTGIEVGRIKSQSGKMLACDPIVMQDANPFYADFPIGEFPVQLAVAKFGDDERVAFSRILFSVKPVAKWEMARQRGQKPLPVFGPDLYGYSVDGSVGLFIDSVANQEFGSLVKKDFNTWIHVFNEEIDKHMRNSWSFTVFDFQEHNLVAFTTGFGDGRYGSYIGYDANGQICQLLTDFGLVDWIKDK